MFTHHRGWIFLTLISLFFLLVGQAFLGRQGLLLGFIAATVLNFYIYFVSQQRIFRFFDAQPFEGQDSWGVSDAITNAVESFHIYPLEVFITKIDSPIAFSTSVGWGRPKIVLSEALLNKLTKDEIKDLLIIHMVYLLTMSSFFIGFRTQFSEIVYIISKFLDSILSLPYIVYAKEKRITFFQKLLLPIGTLFIESQKKKLLEADARAAKLIGSNEKYAKLLWKLQGLIQTKPFPAPPSPAILFATNTLTTHGLDKYFQRHHSLQIRIKKLVGHYPL